MYHVSSNTVVAILMLDACTESGADLHQLYYLYVGNVAGVNLTWWILHQFRYCYSGIISRKLFSVDGISILYLICIVVSTVNIHYDEGNIWLIIIDFATDQQISSPVSVPTPPVMISKMPHSKNRLSFAPYDIFFLRKSMPRMSLYSSSVNADKSNFFGILNDILNNMNRVAYTIENNHVIVKFGPYL